MNIKIISDGTPCGTFVIDRENGKRINAVTRIKWAISTEGLANCTLDLVKVPVELTCEATVAPEKSET